MRRTDEMTLPVSGMSCGSCVGRVERALMARPEVTAASANLASETVTVRGHDLAASDLAKTLAAAGYPARTQRIELTVTGMSCASCLGRVERALAAVPGVIRAEVNLATERAMIEVLEGSSAPDAAIAAVAEAGYAAARAGKDPASGGTISARKAEEATVLRRMALLSALLTLPVFILEMGGHLVPAFHHWIGQTMGHQTSRVIQFALTTAVLAGPGRQFLRLGIPALLRAAPDMNTLVAIGTTAAWGFSVVATFAPGLLPEGTANVYFEAAAMIVTLILTGRWLEARARGQTGAAIARLIGLQPRSARVEVEGVAVERPIAQIAVGDIVQVRPGERIAVDGRVKTGKTYIDESMISGEPVPVAKGPGDRVIAGTVNGTGALKFVATEVGGDTVLAQIIRMVEQAQGARLPVQDLVNRITLYFVPAVLAVAALTVLGWLVFGPEPALGLALVAGVAVLIIACPCAMGLATPTSIMVGTGRAAELGVLFRKGDALQALSDVSVVALDKTGTLTRGRPEVTDMRVLDGQNENTVLRLVAAVESASEHPLAGAVLRAAEARALDLPEVDGFQSVTGYGVSGRVAGLQVLVGTARLMAREGIATDAAAGLAEGMARTGQTPLFAAIDGRLAAVLGLSDPIKDGTAEAVAALHGLGLTVAMITGDTRATAEAIAAQLGIDRVEAEVLPDGKLAAVAALRAAGGKVAFVGDGINDAPALAAADVGIAIGTGTDVAIESADVVLMSGDLRGVVRALGLSGQVMRNIRQNLAWAFGYNILLIPVAAGVLYPLHGLLLSPALAAGAMALSSVAVLTNALRLRLAGAKTAADSTGAAPQQLRRQPAE